MHVTKSWWVTHGFHRYANGPRRGPIAALLARIAKQLPRAEDGIADRYSGCGWSDEIERRALDDFFDGNRRSI